MDPAETQVLGISVDSFAANAEFAKRIGMTFPLLSDMTRKVTKEYGILNDQYQFANRTTFVVDKNGIIRHIEEGGSAVDPTNAINICTGLKKKEAK